MRKKEKRTLLFLTLAVIVLAAVLAAVSYEPPPKALPRLAELDPSQVTELSWSNRQGSFRLERGEAGWILTEDPAFPVDQQVLSSLVQRLCEAVAVEELQADPDQAEACGLSEPQCVLEAGDGQKTVELVFGSMNQVTDQIYVQTSDGLWLAAPELLQAFSGGLLELAQMEEIPKPEQQLQVVVENFQGRLLLSCQSAVTGGEEGTWYAAVDGAFREADQQLAYNFYFLTWDMRFLTKAAYVTDPEELAAFGLDHPQAIYRLTYGEDGQEKTFCLRLGTVLPDNTCYAMCEGGSLIYTMDAVLSRFLSEAKTADVLPRT